jgi:hypothetical protein
MSDHMLAVRHVVGQVHEDAHARTESGGRSGRQVWTVVQLIHVCMTWTLLALGSTIDTQQGAHLRNMLVMGLYGQTHILMQKKTSFQKTHFITWFLQNIHRDVILAAHCIHEFPKNKLHASKYQHVIYVDHHCT